MNTFLFGLTDCLLTKTWKVSRVQVVGVLIPVGLCGALATLLQLDYTLMDTVANCQVFIYLFICLFACFFNFFFFHKIFIWENKNI